MSNMWKFFQEMTGHGATDGTSTDGGAAAGGGGGSGGSAAETFHEIFNSLLGAQKGHVSNGYFHHAGQNDEGLFCMETKMAPSKMAEYFTANNGDVSLGKCSEDPQYSGANWDLQGTQSFRVQNKFYADFSDPASVVSE